MSEIDRRSIALMTLRARLRLELKFKDFASGGSGRHTMRCAKHWLPGVRTRAQALAAIEKELAADAADAKRGDEPDARFIAACREE